MDFLGAVLQALSDLWGNGFNTGSDYLQWMWDGSATQINGDGSSPVLTP